MQIIEWIEIAFLPRCEVIYRQRGRSTPDTKLLLIGKVGLRREHGQMILVIPRIWLPVKVRGILESTDERTC